MRWRLRYAKFVLGGSAVGWAVWRYLLPGLLAGPVAARLEAAYGTPVRLDAVHVGWGGTSLRGLKLYEAGAGPGGTPWAAAAEVRTDVTPWRALTGRAAPRDVTLEDAAVLLRFDRQGGLLTRMPDGGGGGTDLPVIRLRRGRLTVQQDGRANDLVIHGVTAEARSDGGRLVLEGAAADPTWGVWAASGGRDRAGEALRVTFTADRVNVTPARLMELPLIPPTLWEQVRGEGETAVECTVRAHPGGAGVSLRVALTPWLMTVRLPTLGLTVDRAKGTVVYENGVVRLRGAECVLAGGRLGVEGEFDLRAAGSDADIRLALDATDVDVRRLPAAWNVPARLEGRVTGRADVRVTRAGDRTRVAGTGRGQLRGVPIGGRPATVALALREEALPGSAAPAACCLVAELDEGDADLGRLVNEAGIDPPFPITGRLALRVRLAVPLDTLDDPQTFRVQATAVVPRVTCGDVVLEGITARIGYNGGVLRLDECGGTVPRPPGLRPQTRGRAVLEGVRVRVACAGIIAGPSEFNASASAAGAGLVASVGAGAFRLEGAVDLRRATRGGAILEEVRARTAFTVGRQKDSFCGIVPRPLAAAAVGPGLVLPQALSARLTLDAIPLSLLAPTEPGNAPAVDGTLSATATAWAPLARLDRASAWNGSGAVTAQLIRAAGRAAPGSARADLELQRGVLSATGLDGRLGGAAVTGRGDVEVGATWRFRATLGLAADLAALRQLNPAWPPDPAVAGRVAATALVAGSLSPFRVEGAGNGTGAGLEVGGIPVAGLRFRWHADAARLAVRDVRAEVFGGHLSGEVDIPLRATEPGRLDLHARDVDLPTLAAAVPGNTFRPEGRVSGRARAVIGAAGPAGDRSLTAGFDVQTPAATADGAVAYRAGTLAYRLDGAALGGRFHLDGRLTPADAGTADRPPDGCLRLDGLDLGRACELLGVQAAAGPFGGTAGAEIRFRHHGPDLRPVGLGSVAVRRLRWGEVELAPEVKAVVRLTPLGLELAEVTGAVCGGEFKGQAVLDWSATSGRIALSLTGADASRVLAPWPALAAQVRGPLAAHVRVTPGAEWKAVGRLTLRRGRVAGVEVAELELPVEACHTPALGQGWVEVREGTAQIALGRAVGRGACRWGAGTQVEGAVRFTGLDLRHLFPAAASERVVAGLLSGRVEVRGTDVRTLDDVAGSLDCTLRQTIALAFPVLRDLVPFVEPAGSERTVFDTGECRARLTRGVVRVERLALVGPTVRLALDGTAGPDDRLGLNVAVHTGRLGVAPDAPVSVRLIRLRVDGTVPRPLVRVGP